jgi:hypothetical protein
MFRKYYTTEELLDAVKNSTSIAGVLKKLNLKAVGGNYCTIKRKIEEHSIDCSHFKGQAWNKGNQLKNWSNYTRSTNLKAHLIKKFGHQCQKCKNETWNDQPITLELHHVDGNRTNNAIENLQLLCPNCHSCTDNWRGRKKKAG